MDDKWKSRKLFVWIVSTVMFYSTIVIALITKSDIFSPKFFIIFLIIWGVITAFYLLGQTLVDIVKDSISTIVEKIANKAADKLANKIE